MRDGVAKLTRLTTTAACAAGTLSVLQVARASGAAVPRPAVVLAAAVSTVLAGAVAARTAASIWRGPVVLSFRRQDAVLCDAAEAAAIRAAAQLRGTMGGAGHVAPPRLMFPALAWTAIAGQSAAWLVPGALLPVPWALAIGTVAGLLTVVLPARSFWYREVTGGCVLVHPAPACRRLLDAARVPPAVAWLDLDGCDRRGLATRESAVAAAAEGDSGQDEAQSDA